MGCMNKWLWSAEGSQIMESEKIRQNKFQGQSASTKHWFGIDHE